MSRDGFRPGFGRGGISQTFVTSGTDGGLPVVWDFWVVVEGERARGRAVLAGIAAGRAIKGTDMVV